MGTLVLSGATSGSATLTPVDAVTAVITLPSATATLATLGANTFVGNQAITGALSVSTTLGVTGAATLSSTLAVTGAVTLSSTLSALAITGNSFIPNSATIPSNGLYLSAANTLALSVNSANGLTLSTTGLSIANVLTIGSNAAAAGSLRMPFNAAIAGRNNANTGDVNIAYIDTGDKLVLGGAAGVNLPAGANLSIAVDLGVANNLVLGDSGTTYNSGRRYVYIYGVSGLAGYIAHDGATTVSYTSVSDARNKNDLGPASDADAADRLLRYEIRNYTWKHTPDEVKIGGMAQQIHSVNPQVGHMGGEDAKLDPWTIEKAAYTDDLVLGWQNHEAKITALEARLAALETK